MRTQPPISAPEHDLVSHGTVAMPEQRDPIQPSHSGVGALLARERAKNGWTQAQLAERAGTTQAAVSRIETGSSSPSMRSLQRLAQALGMQFTLVLRKGDQTIGELAGGTLQ